MLPDELLESVAGASGLAEPAEFVSAVLAEPDPLLKSVAYQPLPFNWKPAAVKALPKALLPHAGQVSMGASLIFCR